jgi:hypothetical protein
VEARCGCQMCAVPYARWAVRWPAARYTEEVKMSVRWVDQVYRRGENVGKVGGPGIQKR